MQCIKTIVFIGASTLSVVAQAGPNASPALGTPYISCADDAAKYQARSQELQRLVGADQADRPDNILKPGAQLRDRERRERVAAIFGEGCFKEARDFAAAALVFQHGDRPEHFFQAYVWAKTAVELGDESQRGLVLMAIDRYLLNTKRKQLFATQYNRPSLDPTVCWCLAQTESAFPDSERLKLGGKTYQQKLEFLSELNKGLSCPLSECPEQLAPTPVGTVPGLW